MGVDTVLTLPPQVRLRDVSHVIGILLGCPVSLDPLGPDSISCNVEGVDYKPSSIATCANIVIRNRKIAAADFLYHFEMDGGARGILFRARAERIALAIRLVQFFGGSVDFNDCDDAQQDFRLSPRFAISPTDGKEWDDFERAKAALVPITKAEIDACEQYAAYKKEGR